MVRVKKFVPVMVAVALLVFSLAVLRYGAHIDEDVDDDADGLRDEYGALRSPNVWGGDISKRYVSPDGTYEFSFPADWVVESESYIDAGDAGQLWSVVIRENVCGNPDNWVYVNPDADECDSNECSFVGNNIIMTRSDDPEFYDAYQEIVESFVLL